MGIRFTFDKGKKESKKDKKERELDEEEENQNPDEEGVIDSNVSIKDLDKGIPGVTEPLEQEDEDAKEQENEEDGDEMMVKNVKRAGRPKKDNKKEENEEVDEDEEKTLKIEYSRTDAVIRVRELENDEDVNMFLKVENGKRKFVEMQELTNFINS